MTPRFSHRTKVVKTTESLHAKGNGKTLKFFRPAPMQGTSRPPTLAGGRRAWRARHGSKVGPALRLPFSFSFLPLLICTADRARAPPWVKSRNALAFYWCASATCDASGARGEFCRRRERTADATADRAQCTQHLAVVKTSKSFHP